MAKTNKELKCKCGRKRCRREKCKHYGHRYRRTLAERADKYELYQRAVQAPDADLDFVDEVFEEHFGDKPVDIREDFCGTALTASRWVKRRTQNRAWGVDLDPEPMDWGRARHIKKLKPAARERLTLIEGDVMESGRPPVDVVLAQNFSYCIFKEREALRRYFEIAKEGLRDQGLFILDVFGGPESQMPARDRNQHKGFTYIWHQKRYNAITSEILCHIHFTFPDGSKMKKAFTYDWRLWTVQELKELLLEVGFTRADAYWEGPGDDGTGDGIFVRKSAAENEDAWIAYVVGSLNNA